MSEHVNEHQLAPGQQQGENHPENPFSEYKYPIFFRLFNRGDLEAKAPLDLDDDHYFVQNGDKYKEMIQKNKDALVKAEVDADKALETTIAPASYVDSAPEQFDVLGEAHVDAMSRNALSKVISHAKSVAAQLGMKNLSAEDLNQISKLADEYKAALSANNSDAAAKIYEQYDTLRRRGVTKDVFQQYQAEVQNFANNLAPQAQTAELVVEPEVFYTVEGGDVRMGGWYDADCIPDAMKKHWVENGLVMQVPKSKLEKLSPSQILGKDVGKKLDQHALKVFDYRISLKKQKHGSRVAIGIYGGMAAWALYFKWVQSNQREFYRQKSKVALRWADVKLNPVQAAIAKKHMEWAKSYYEEEEDQ